MSDDDHLRNDDRVQAPTRLRFVASGHNIEEHNCISRISYRRRAAILCPVIRALALRIQHRRVLFGMLQEFALGIRPGSERSSFPGMSPEAIAKSRSRLAAEFLEAIEDVARTSRSVESVDDLRRLAAAVRDARARHPGIAGEQKLTLEEIFEAAFNIAKAVQ